MNLNVVMIAFKNVMPAKAQYTQSCRVMAAHTSTAAIRKKMIAVLRYHCGDAPARCWSMVLSLSERSFFCDPDFSESLYL